MANTTHLLGHKEAFQAHEERTRRLREAESAPSAKTIDLRRVKRLRTAKAYYTARLLEVSEQLGEVESMEGALSDMASAGLMVCASCSTLLDSDDEDAGECRRCGSSDVTIQHSDLHAECDIERARRST